jgi:hypothetical protein
VELQSVRKKKLQGSYCDLKFLRVNLEGWCTLIEDLYEKRLIVLTRELMMEHGYHIDIDAVMLNNYLCVLN